MNGTGHKLYWLLWLWALEPDVANELVSWNQCIINAYTILCNLTLSIGRVIHYTL